MGGVAPDGEEQGGHDTSVLQTNTVLLHRHKVWDGLLLSCLQRVVSVEVYVFLGSLERHCNSFMVFYSKLDNQV